LENLEEHFRIEKESNNNLKEFIEKLVNEKEELIKKEGFLFFFDF
jgi:hypothetical protein